jgi:hypothetical protein
MLIVVVADQEPRPFAKSGRLAQLLGCPLIGRVSRHTKVNDSPGAKLNDRAPTAFTKIARKKKS